MYDSAVDFNEPEDFLPKSAQGWNGLSYCLGLHGIWISGTALEKRRRSHGLPARGGGTKGRPVWFGEAELDAWTRHLTGLRLDACVRGVLLAAAEGCGPPRLPILRRPPRRGSVGVLPQWPLYALTVSFPSLDEQVARAPDGWVYAASDPSLFQELSAARGASGPPPRAWLYQDVRFATAADLKVPSGGRLRRRRAGRLLGALEREGRELRWVEVPGEFFHLTKSVRTRCLVARGLPRFTELVRWVADSCPQATWLIWIRRQEVSPITLEDVGNDSPVAYDLLS